MIVVCAEAAKPPASSSTVAAAAVRPRSIIVNQAGRRFVNEACDYNSMAGAFHYLDPRGGYVNDRGWMVFDSIHLQRYGFLGIEPGQPVPDWFCESADLAELAAKAGIDGDGLTRTVENWNRQVAAGADPDFGRGSSAYDGYWGDDSATTPAGKTLGPIDTAPFYAVPVNIGVMGTKGGPRTDHDARVLHVGGEPLRDERRYSVTASDLELAPYGGLVTAAPDDLRHDSSVILPEVLEAWFSRASA